MTYYFTSPTPGYAPSGDYILDWDLTGADGSAVLSSASGNQDVGVTVSTPTSSEGKDFELDDGKLVSDDNASEPITTEITFDQPVTDVTFQLVDVDAGWDFDDKVTILAYDADGNLVDVDFSDLDPSHTVDGNSVEGGKDLDGYCETDADNVTVSIAGPITKLVVVHEDGDSADEAGVVKITDLGFNAVPAPELDGIVQGSAGDDLIDYDYTGDPDGDMVDHGDAILPGETGDDDIIVAGADNDTVLAGDGNDEVYAGAGDDYVEGGAGDDEIWGDSNGGYTDGGSAREVLQWDQAPNYGDEQDAANFTQNTGSVDVSFTVLSGSCSAQVEYEDATNNVDGIDTGTLGAVDPNSGLAFEGDGRYDDASVQLSFSEAVSNVQFRVNDIDYDSSVKVLAFDADGNALSVDLAGGVDLNISGDTAYATGAGLDPTADANSMLVEIAGPVASIQVVHDITGSDTSHVQLSDVYFDAPDDGLDVGDGAPGNDELYGGEGDDIIHGEEGDDLLDGGAGDDVLWGDEPAGSSGDTVLRESFNWEGYDDAAVDTSIVQDTGHVTVTYARTEDVGSHFTEPGTEDLNVDGIDTGGEVIDSDSSLHSENANAGESGTFQWDFSEPVENVEFNVNDIDGDGVVRITAYDADGNQIPVELLGGDKLTLLDTDSVAGVDTADSEGGYDASTAADYNLQVSIAGPVASIVVEHEQDGDAVSGINITDMYFDVTVPGDGSEGGDDVLIGGEGADEMHGEGADDTFIVDTAADGDGDVVVGGNGPDDSTDHDVLDLRGAGKVTIDQSADASDEGASMGTVTFADGGTLSFSQIEEILTDPQNEDPDAVDDAAKTHIDTPVVIAVLDNDSDPDGDPLQVIDASSSDGTVAINADGTITFTPAAGFDGTAAISYTISDGNGGTDSAMVSVLVNDGIVEGTTGDDLIDIAYTGDPEGDMVDHLDEFLPGEGPNDDIILGYAGDDTVYAGEGDDEVYGGPGDDTLHGETGDDTLIGGDGSDTVFGGEGDDYIDTSGSAPASDYGWPPLVPEDADKTNDIDYVEGGAGNDTIKTGDDADTILGGTGDDYIDGGLDDDTIDGGADDDMIIGGHGSDTIDGGTGNDTIYGGLGPDPSLDPLNIVDAYDPRPDNGIDVIHGGDGNDVIYGQDDDDVLYGDAGDDYIDGGIDNDTIHGGTGNDTLLGGQGDDEIFGGEGDDSIDGGEGDDLIHGGEGADTLLGGDDRDTFDQVNVGDYVHGNSGGDDFDTLDLTGSAPVDGSLHVTVTGPDSDGNGIDGYVSYFDKDGNDLGTLDFYNIEKVIPCFTPGTLIATPKGERRVEELQPGDRVITRDNGIQEIKWVGQKAISYKELATADHLKPVLIRAGALGNGLPERDMMVSPNHRVLVANDQTTLYFDEREVLAAAKHLVDNKGISVVEPLGVSYIHFMFDHHEVVLSDGAWTESFQPGDHSLKGIGNAQRQELFELFPELETEAGIEDYAAARRILKKHEAQMLVRK